MKTPDVELASKLRSAGASLVGFADLREIAIDTRDSYPFGISIAVALNPDIVRGINNGPNSQYYNE